MVEQQNISEIKQQIKEIQQLIEKLEQSISETYSPVIRLEILVMGESLNRILESLIEFSVNDFNSLINKKR